MSIKDDTSAFGETCINQIQTNIKEIFNFVENTSTLDPNIWDQLKKYQEATDHLIKKAKLAKQKERTSKTPNFVIPKEEMPSAKKSNKRKWKRRTEA